MSDLEEFFSLPSSGREWDPATVRLIVSMMRKDLTNLAEDVEEHERCRVKEMQELKDSLERNFAPKTEFLLLQERVRKPIAMAYGLATLILALVLTALVSLVVRNHGGG